MSYYDREEHPWDGYYCSQCTHRDDCEYRGGRACRNFDYDM